MHRAGGITGILGELDRAGKLHRDVHSIDYKTLEDKLNDWDIMRNTCTEEAKQMYLAAPGHIVSLIRGRIPRYSTPSTATV